jgi:hypothetical protein
MEESTAPEVSVFQTKYDEFVEDLLGALPEYAQQIQAAKALDTSARLNRFQEEIKVDNTFVSGETEDNTKNPGKVLPGVEISDTIWAALSENTHKAIWEYVRILSVCCFMEAGFSDGTKAPAWMDDAMNEMKKKLESVDFQNIFKKFMTFFKSEGGKDGEEGAKEEGLPAGFEKLFENGFPKLPERFLKGHMAKLAQEIVKDIKPEDLGITPEMVAECEKNPSRAFDILFQVFGSNPGVIQKTVQKVGKRLQQKFMSGAINPKEIAREAEELMKEFAGNGNFVEMMEGIKGAFGFGDMDMARQAGREGSARLAIAKERLKKKASEKEAKKAAQQAALVAPNAAAVANAEAAMAALLMEEANKKARDNEKKKPTGNGGKK